MYKNSHLNHTARHLLEINLNLSEHIYSAIITSKPELLSVYLKDSSLDDLEPQSCITALDMASDLVIDSPSKKAARIFQMILIATVYHHALAGHVTEVNRLITCCGRLIDIDREVCPFTIRDALTVGIEFTKDLIGRSHWQPCYKGKTQELTERHQNEKKILAALQCCKR